MRPCIPEHRLEIVMSIISERDLPLKTRQAVRLVVLNGYTYELAEIKSGVTRKTIAKAVKHIDKIDTLLVKTYRKSI